jgi:hypothetical protein
VPPSNETYEFIIFRGECESLGRDNILDAGIQLAAGSQLSTLLMTCLVAAAAATGEDIQDLTVMSQPPGGQGSSSVPDDPAIISAVRSSWAAASWWC